MLFDTLAQLQFDLFSEPSASRPPSPEQDHVQIQNCKTKTVGEANANKQ